MSVEPLAGCVFIETDIPHHILIPSLNEARIHYQLYPSGIMALLQDEETVEDILEEINETEKD